MICESQVLGLFTYQTTILEGRIWKTRAMNIHMTSGSNWPNLYPQINHPDKQLGEIGVSEKQVKKRKLKLFLPKCIDRNILMERMITEET